MQGFCERFLRFVADEIADPEDWGDCSCQDQGLSAQQTTSVEDKASAVEAGSRLEPFRPSVRINVS